MDLDADLFFNFVPIISASFIVFITCFTIFLKIRNRWPVKVNCWFCNGNSKICRQSLKWWLCNHCKQYNGFSKNGDYSYKIPEQHRISSEYKNKSYCKRKTYFNSENKLCNKCNRREELKLIKLRELENSMEELNEKQIIEFEQNFDKKYPLCLKCQSIVQIVLNKQKIWFMEYKMLLFKQKPFSRLIKNREKIVKILRVLLSILASITIYYFEAWYLPLCGIALQLSAFLFISANRGYSDIFPLLGWICLACIRSFSTTTILKLLNINFNSHWTTDDNTYQYFIITLGTAIVLLNLRTQYHKTISNKLLFLKKLKSPRNNNVVMHSYSQKSVTPQNQEIPCSKQSTELTRELYSPINITNSLMTPETVEMPIPIKPMKSINSSEWSSNKTSFEAYPKKANNSTFSSSQNNSFSRNFSKDIYSISDSLTNLNFLDSHNKKVLLTRNSNQGIFETRVYDSSSPDLFSRSRNSCYTQKRSVLAPPRLCLSQTMMETSWVASGYWQSPSMKLTEMLPSLSRSSSQSSGIGSSTGSMCGQSRESSFHKLDQFSATSFSEQRSSRPNDSTLFVTSDACRHRNYSNCSVSPITQKNESNESVKQRQCHLKHEVQCCGHTTTIVMNSKWLPAVLCVSLVLNMFVFCTTLLR